CYEYLNTLGWFFDNFEHKHQIKLLYLAASYVNRAAWHQKGIGDAEPVKVRAAIAANKMSPEEILDRVDAAVVALNGPDSTAWTKAYLDTGADRKPLVQRLALLACRMGNDPHNQEIGQVLLEDYGKNQGWNGDRLLVACAHHTAVHRKYGNPLDCANRFGSAMGIARLQKLETQQGRQSRVDLFQHLIRRPPDHLQFAGVAVDAAKMIDQHDARDR